MHGMLGAGEQFDEGPEGVFFVHVHEEQSRDLAHPLTVPDFLKTNENKETGDVKAKPHVYAHIKLALQNKEKMLKHIK